MLHIPSFMERGEELKQKGVEQLVCVSVNDVFVMDAWGKSLGAENILMVVRVLARSLNNDSKCWKNSKANASVLRRPGMGICAGWQWCIVRRVGNASAMGGFCCLCLGPEMFL